MCVCVAVCSCSGADAQLKGHTAGELVSLAELGDGVRVDLALHIDVCVEGDVHELHGHQGLGVVHLHKHAHDGYTCIITKVPLKYK